MTRSYQCDKCKNHIIGYSPFATVSWDPNTEQPSKDLCKSCFLKIFKMKERDLEPKLKINLNTAGNNFSKWMCTSGSLT